MATGVVVEFEAAKKPSVEKIQALAEDYFGQGLAAITRGTPRDGADDSWLYLTLPGRPSNMLVRQEHTSMHGIAADQLYAAERTVEVCAIDDKVVEVMARHGDQFTHDIANGLAHRLAEVFGGTVLPV